MNEGYIYEWAFGTDEFTWYYLNKRGELVEVILDSWKEFISIFNKAGIDLYIDCVDPENGNISQNIIHQFPRGASASNPKLNRLWKRIDFGPRSIRVNYQTLMNYLVKNEKDIRRHLTVGRYEFMVLTCKYLSDSFDINPKEAGKLEILTREYRYSTLAHLNTRGVDSAGKIRIE